MVTLTVRPLWEPSKGAELWGARCLWVLGSLGLLLHDYTLSSLEELAIKNGD